MGARSRRALRFLEDHEPEVILLAGAGLVGLTGLAGQLHSIYDYCDELDCLFSLAAWILELGFQAAVLFTIVATAGVWLKAWWGWFFSGLLVIHAILLLAAAVLPIFPWGLLVVGCGALIIATRLARRYA